MTEPIDNKGYTEDEISEAYEQISKLTPINYLTMVDQANSSELAPLPEARNSVNIVCVTPDGAEMQLTVRSLSFTEMLDRLMGGIRYAYSTYGIRPLVKHTTPSAPVTTPVTGNAHTLPPPALAGVAQPVQPVTPVAQSQQPQQAQQSQQSGIEVFEVKSVFVAYTMKNHSPFLKVRGGKYMKFGVAAYNDILPVDFQEIYPEGLTPEGQTIEYSPTPDMKWAHYDTNAKKVIAFTAIVA